MVDSLAELCGTVPSTPLLLEFSVRQYPAGSEDSAAFCILPQFPEVIVVTLCLENPGLILDQDEKNLLVDFLSHQRLDLREIYLSTPRGLKFFATNGKH